LSLLLSLLPSLLGSISQLKVTVAGSPVMSVKWSSVEMMTLESVN